MFTYLVAKNLELIRSIDDSDLESKAVVEVPQRIFGNLDIDEDKGKYTKNKLTFIF